MLAIYVYIDYNRIIRNRKHNHTGGKQMKKINVFDMYKVIKDPEGEKYRDMDEELLEILDTMLDTYGVPHAFSECRTEDIDKDETSVVTVMYNSEDCTKFTLVYALFVRTYRGADDEMVKDAMKNFVAA